MYFLLQVFLSNLAGTFLWVCHWCLLWEIYSPCNCWNFFQLPKGERWKELLSLQHTVLRKTAEMVITLLLCTDPALILAIFPHWILLRLTWSSSPLEEKIFPFRFPGNILFISSYTGRNGKLHPLPLPSCRRGEKEVSLSLNMLFFLTPWKMK